MGSVEGDSFNGVVGMFDPFPERQSPEPDPSSWGGSLDDMPDPYAAHAAARVAPGLEQLPQGQAEIAGGAEV